jgi:hypothetical protein
MSRCIVSSDEGLGFSMFSFWSGSMEMIQLSFSNGSFVVFPRDKLLSIFEDICSRVRSQIRSDSVDPPWWQKLYHDNVREGK